MVSLVAMLATVLAALVAVTELAVSVLAAVLDPDATELMTDVPVVAGISAVVAEVSVRDADDETGTGVVMTDAAAVVDVGSVDAAVESVAEDAGAAVVPLTIDDRVESVGAIVDADSVAGSVLV